MEENDASQRDELPAHDNTPDDAITEPSLPAIAPAADDTASLGRTTAASDRWEPPLGAWLAPLSADAVSLDALPDPLPDATPDRWPAGPGWAPSPTLANQPTRRMRRRGADADSRPLFFALGALLGAVLVSGAALLAIVYIASHPGMFTLASHRPPVAAPTATLHPTPTATRTPTPAPTTGPVGAKPLPVIIQPIPTARPTPQSTATPTPAPSATATAQPTTSPTPTAEPEPTTAPTATPATTPTPTATTAPTVTPTATPTPDTSP